MYLKLRIFFTVLSAICVAAVFPVGIFFDFLPALVCAGAAALFFAIMLFFKKKQEQQDAPPEKRNDADFFHPQNENDENKDA